MRNAKYLIGIGIIAALLIAGYFAFRDLLSPTLDVVHPRRGVAVEAVYATGTVEPTVMMPIAARTTARLVALNVDEGAVVKKGQILGRLEDQDLQNSLAALQAEEEFNREDYHRDAAMLAQNAIARAVVDRARSNWLAARANVERARNQQDFMKLLAPSNGVIIKRDGEIGELIPVNQAVFWMAARSLLRISAEVDEEDISHVHIGQNALLRADAIPGRVMYGEVQSITPKGDPVARSYRVRISLPADTPLMIGMTAEANIVIHRNPHALLVPLSALRGTDIWRVEGGRLRMVSVVLGAKDTESVEIVRGLSERDVVLRDPPAQPTEGGRARTRLVAQ